MYTEDDMKETEKMIINESRKIYERKLKNTMEKNSTIKSPNHYTWHPKAECIDIIQYFPFNLATAIQYIWRCNYKGSKEEDLLKAIEHIQFELKKMEADVLEQPGKAKGYLDR